MKKEALAAKRQEGQKARPLAYAPPAPAQPHCDPLALYTASDVPSLPCHDGRPEAVPGLYVHVRSTSEGASLTTASPARHCAAEVSLYVP